MGQLASKTYNNFALGLHTDVSPFNFPEGSTSDELNIDINKQGGRHPRLGLNIEPNGSWYNLDIGYKNRVMSYGEWKNVGEVGGKNFIVVQTGNILHFYKSNVEEISNNKLSFTVDLDDYKAPYAGAVNSKCDFSSNNGMLFVVSDDTEPVYITYDSNTLSVSVTQFTIKIRDIEGLAVDYEPDYEPDELTPTHEFNLRNNGWNNPTRAASLAPRDPIARYYSKLNIYPPLSKQWWTTQDPLVEDWMATRKLAQFPTGNTWAPKGHFIHDAFTYNREEVSGVSGVDSTIISKRPVAVESFAGRMFYSEGDKIYFSQLIRRDLFRVGWCYQEADPTAKDINALVDTDGGVISILEAGEIAAMKVFGRSLFVFASNGCWEITGSVGSGFKPTDYSVKQLSTLSTMGQSIIDVKAALLWPTTEGVFTIQPSEQQDSYTLKALSGNRIDEFYNAIPNKDQFVTGFDSLEKKCYFIYNDDPEATTIYNQFNSVLVFSTGYNGFYPWKISTDPEVGPWISGSIAQANKLRFVSEEPVLTSLGEIVVDSDGETVTSVEEFRSDNSVSNKFLLSRVLNNSFDISFGYFYDETNLDFTTEEYDAYMESGFLIEGDISTWRQLPYIWFFFKQDGYNSSCLFRTKWDSYNDESVDRWSTQYDVYSNPGPYKDIAVSKHRVRGHGKVMKLRFDKNENKSFTLWAVSTQQEQMKG